MAAEVSFYSGATIFESLALGDVVSVCFCTSLPLGSQSSGIERKLNVTIQSQGLCIPVRLHFLVFRSNVAKHTYSAKISSLALDLEIFGSFGQARSVYA